MSRLALIVLLLLGPAALNGLTSCDTCNPAPYRFGVADYQVYGRRLASSTYRPYLTDTLAINDSVTIRQLELILIGQERAVALNDRQAGSFDVYACSPAYIPVDSISSLTISSNQPYTTNLPDQDLSTLLTIGQSTYDQEPLTNFTISSTQLAQPFYSLQFRQPPTQTGWYSFKGAIQLTSGRLYHFASRPIFIRK